MTTVLAGEPPAEWFDRLPPRQLAHSRESWRFSFSEGSHPTEHPWRGVYAPSNRQSIDSYTADGSMARSDIEAHPSEMERVG